MSVSIFIHKNSYRSINRFSEIFCRRNIHYTFPNREGYTIERKIEYSLRDTY